ncbi:MAG: DMT family transporter [Acidiferrobacter sp.]
MMRLKTGLLLLLSTALMGSSFAISQMGLRYASPLFLAGLRFTFAGLLLAWQVRNRPLPRSWEVRAKIGVIGLLQTAGVMGAIFMSLKTIPSGESALLTFANPLLVVVFGALFAGHRYQGAQWLGVALGTVGLAFATGASLVLSVGVAFGLAAAVFWAVATLLMKRWHGFADLWVLTAYQMLVGGFCLLLMSLFFESPVFHVHVLSVVILAWLVVMASIVQFGVWFYVLHHNNAAHVSAYLFMAPVFGVLSGWALLHQAIGWHVAVGALGIGAGIWLVNSGRNTEVEEVGTL